MAFKLADRVKETTATTGTGTLTLAGAVTGFQSFASALSDNDTTHYVITDATDWECGLGTYTSNTLARTTVQASSNSNNAVNWSAGSKDVFISALATVVQKSHIANSMYATESDLPNATTYHGVLAHVHATGAAYFAHGGAWVKLANHSQLPDISGLATSSSVTSGLATKQDTLTAGSNISIVGSTISSTASGGSSVSVATTAPGSASAGDLWLDSATMKLYVYYTDADSSQWVGIQGGGSGSGSSSGGGVTTGTGLPGSASAGDLFLNTNSNTLYVYNTSWIRVQSGGNSSPIFTTTPLSTLALATDGSTSTLSAVAVDSEGTFPITYDYDILAGSTVYSPHLNSGALPNMLTNVSESSGVFTLTPSSNAAHVGSLIFRTKASDGAMVATASTTVSLTFWPTSGTVYRLEGADTNSYSGSGTTWADVSGTSTIGNATLNNNSIFDSATKSFLMGGASDDNTKSISLPVAASQYPFFGSGDWSMSFRFKVGSTLDGWILDAGFTSSSTLSRVQGFYVTGGSMGGFINNSDQTNDINVDYTDFSPNTWYTLVITRNKTSGVTKAYIDGSLDTTTTQSSGYNFYLGSDTPNNITLGLYRYYTNSVASGQSPFEGNIAAFAIFNTELSASDASTIHNYYAGTYTG